MNNVIIVTDLFLLLLWARIWIDSDQEFYFNPLLSAPVRLTDRIFDFLRPVFIGLPSRGIALFTLLFLLAFRGAVVYKAAAAWSLTVGMVVQRQLPLESWQACMLFSGLEFLVFLVRLWGLALLISLITPTRRPDRATLAFRFFTVPFSVLPRLPLAACVVLLNVLVMLALQHVGVQPMTESIVGLKPLDAGLDWAQPIAALVQLGWLTALSLSDVLLMARSAMLVCVFTGLGAALLQKRGLQQLCNEAVQVLLGGFGRRPLLVGMMDLTPIVYFMALDFLYRLAVGVLHTLMTNVQWGA